MSRIKTILVDCFDTIIYRKVPSEKVKYLWAEKMSHKYNLSVERWYSLFLSAEETIRYTNKIKTGIDECNIHDIAELCFNRIKIYNLLGNIDQHEFVKDFYDVYVLTEKEVQYLNKKVVKKLKQYKKHNLKIMVISDFYCGEDTLREFFEQLGIVDIIDKIYVSCDYMKTKSTGSLYKTVFEKECLLPEECLMMGDNKRSDNLIPKTFGIKCVKVKEKNKIFKLKEKINKVILSKEITRILKTNKTNAYSNYAFSLYLFIKKLADSLNVNHVKNVFFLSREGEFLKKLFDYYIKHEKSEIKSHYLMVSRNSVLIAGLDAIQNENFETIIRENGVVSGDSFLETLNFPNEMVKKIKEEVNEDFKIERRDFLQSSLYKKLTKNKDFIDYYNKQRAQQNYNFMKYLNSFGVDYEKEGLDIVDVGWKGTMQDLLCKFFDSKVAINGYYIGYTGRGIESINNKKYGLLFSNSPFRKNLESRIFEREMPNYEEVLRASHNRVVGYKEDENIVYPIIEDSYDDAFYNAHIKEYQDEMFEKFKQIANLVCEDKELMCVMAHIEMHKMINFKTLNFINDCKNAHYDSFATTGFIQKKKITIKTKIRYILSKIKYRLKILLRRI